MATEKTQKNAKKYECIICYFVTCNKSDYNRHLSTDKHIGNVLATDGNGKNANIYMCNYCDKDYHDRSGLWRHSKKCVEIPVFNEPKNEIIADKELIMMLVKQNTELLEVLKNGTTNNSHNSTNNNSHNKTFNLQFFLNETCKDAMNIMDFVDSIKLQLSDLERVGELGYVEGISNIITSKLKALDVTQRPVHCTDKKRETIYIRDENKWEKEDEEKKKLRKVIKRVATKNQRLLETYRELHPDYIKASSPFSDKYNQIFVESLGGSGDNDLEKENKIIKNITKQVHVDKGL